MGGRMKGCRAGSQLWHYERAAEAHMIVVHDGDRPR
jgi:hypothetical protein